MIIGEEGGSRGRKDVRVLVWVVFLGKLSVGRFDLFN